MKHTVQMPDGEAGGGAAAAAGAGTAAGGAASGAGTGTGAGGAAAGAAGASGAAGAAAGAGDAGGAHGASAAGGAGAGAAAGAQQGGEAGAGAAAAGAAAQPSWDADHWRGTWAGDDAKKKAFAERYTDQKSIIDAAYTASQKIDQLTVAAKKVLPDNATPEQLTAYRKDNGIPEKPEAYLEALPADVRATLDDTDKEIITPYLAALQEANIPPAVVSKLIALRQAESDRQVEVRHAADLTLQKTTEDALRGDWGNNYRAEINNIHAFLNGFSEDVREAILQSRTPDGNPLVGSPDVVKALAQMARMVNPYQVPIGNDGGTLDQKGVDQRISEIEGWMGSKAGSEGYTKYWKNDKVQAEYRSLLDAKDAMKKRSAAA